MVVSAVGSRRACKDSITRHSENAKKDRPIGSVKYLIAGILKLSHEMPDTMNPNAVAMVWFFR